MPKLKQAELKEYRRYLLRLQNNQCPLCLSELLEEDAVLDHCHTTGHIRFVLHRGCNRAEGTAKAAVKRSRASQDPKGFMARVLKYWDADFSGMPIHPSYKTEDDRRLAALKKRLPRVTMTHARRKIEREIRQIKIRQGKIKPK